MNKLDIIGPAVEYDSLTIYKAKCAAQAVVIAELKSQVERLEKRERKLSYCITRIYDDCRTTAYMRRFIGDQLGSTLTHGITTRTQTR